MSHQFFSARAEAILKTLSPRAVDVSPSVGGHSDGVKLTLCETGSQTRFMSRLEFLVLAVYFDWQNSGDRKELRQRIFEEFIKHESWFKPEKFLKDKAYQNQVEGLVRCALDFIRPVRLPESHKTLHQPTQALLAQYMNLYAQDIKNRRAALCGNSWWQVYHELKAFLVRALHNAALTVHSQSILQKQNWD